MAESAMAPPTPSGHREVAISCSPPAAGTDVPASPSLPAAKDGYRRTLLLTVLGIAAIAACAALAAMVAGSEGDAGDAIEVSKPPLPRRTSENSTTEGLQMVAAADVGPHSQSCHTAKAGEPCHRHVTWAMQHGIHSNPEWYPGLTTQSTFAEFQQVLAAMDEFAQCPMPCGLARQNPWCSPAPMESLSLKDCSRHQGSQRVKVLTYNLFWWNLFGRRRGNGGSAGHLLRGAMGGGPFDVMAFQEADDVWWPLRDAGLAQGEYESESALGMALVWRSASWHKLSAGLDRIAEDRPDQWYGARGVLWVRLQNHQTGRTLLFANHHGPLPVGTGGVCGGQATAYNILRLLQRTAGPTDAIILTGDFNADQGSETFRTLLSGLHHVFSGSAFGGVDHFFGSCSGPSVAETANLGSGGSDHDALMAVFNI